MIRIEGVDQYYGQSHILRDFTLHAEAGHVACVMGRNGAGKTTLLKCVMGLLPIRRGEIWLGGMRIDRLPTEARARAGLGYVPQGREIFSLLTVEENLRLPLTSRSDRQRSVPGFIYELFPVLKEMRARRGGDLSGGQQQQLAIGRALLLDPKLLILDEPGEGIQPNIVTQIGQVIRRLQTDLGLSVLLVEQKLPFARQYADSFHLVERGHVEAKGPIDALSDELITRYLNV
ncbi:MAG: urea ABC transporter ATP-binding subunit UrtE [Thioalkalivibrionaceae bacterium]